MDATDGEDYHLESHQHRKSTNEEWTKHLKGLDGIAICADDVIIFGCGEDDEAAERDHDLKLLKLLELCRE